MNNPAKPRMGINSAAGAGAPRNTLRMDSAELSRLCSDMNAAGGGETARRAFLRWPFERTAIRVEISAPDGGVANLQLACRNISGTGVGVLHNSYAHPGAACTVHLPQLKGGDLAVAGRIVRCRHFRGVVHEIGIRFDAAINVRQFVRLDPASGGFTLEHVDPERLCGEVLHVEGSSIDRRLVRHFLRETRLNVVSVNDATAALGRVDEGFDLILCDFDLPDMNGAKLLQTLRGMGIQTTVLLIAARPDAARAAEDPGAPPNAYLSKPLTEQGLLRAMAEFLVLDSSEHDAANSLTCTLTAEDANIDFVPEFLQEAKRLAGDLSAALGEKDREKDLEKIRRICLQVSGTAPTLGFAAVGAAADQVIRAIAGPDAGTEVARLGRLLVSMCMRAKVREPEKKAEKKPATAVLAGAKR